jgi:hypothetical protein
MAGLQTNLQTPLEANERPSSWQRLTKSIGEGFGKGIEQGAQLSLADKMEQLKEQRHIEQASQLRATYAHAARSKGLNQLADLYEAGLDPDKAVSLGAQMPQLFQPETGGAGEAMGALRQPEAEMGGMETTGGEAQPREKAMAKQEEPVKPYDQKLAEMQASPQYKKASVTQQKQMQDALYKSHQAKLGEENVALKREGLQQKKESAIEKANAPYVKKINENAHAATNVINSVNKMREIRKRGRLGPTSGLTFKGRADAAAYEVLGSGVLSLWKTLFPRGFTQLEFKHIEKKWKPDPTNLDSTNEAMENAALELVQPWIDEQNALMSLADKNGKLPEHVEVEVRKRMDELQGKIKDQLLSDFPKELRNVQPGTVMTPEVVIALRKYYGNDEEAAKAAQQAGYVLPGQQK